MDETFKFSDVGRHPLLRTENIDGVLTYFPQRANTYPLARDMPLVNVNAETIKMDITKARRGGMTPLVATGSQSPIHGGFGRGQREFEAAEWREKVILAETDLVKLREIGSLNDLAVAREMLRKKFAVIEERLLNRLEYMRRQVLFDGAVTATDSLGVTVSTAYTHPSYLEVTLSGGDLWSDTANSDPVADLQQWVEEFVDITGFSIKRIVFPLGMLRLLTENAKFRDIREQGAYGAFAGTMDQVQQDLARMAGVPGAGIIEEVPDRLHYETELSSGASFGAGSVTMLDVDQLEAGMYITLNSAIDMDKERHKVLSVSGNTVTLDGTTIARAGGFAAGDSVRYTLPIIPKDKILILGRPGGPLSPVGAEGLADPEFLEGWADVASVISRYPDIMGTPRPGIFTKTIDKTDDDPGHIEQVLGIKALPRVHYNEGWFFATVR